MCPVPEAAGVGGYFIRQQEIALSVGSEFEFEIHEDDPQGEEILDSRELTLSAISLFSGNALL